MYLCGSLLQGHSTPPPPDCDPLEASLTLLDKVEVVFHALNSDRFGLETCVCVCVCVFVSVFMYVCVCSVLVQSHFSGKIHRVWSRWEVEAINCRIRHNPRDYNHFRRNFL